jgi:protein-S-isoprenylcysteine O-methyltransferase Ste14
MAVAVLVLEAVFFAVAFGFRTVVQLRTTGDTGWRLRSEGAAAAIGSAALLVALLLAAAAPLADLAGLARWNELDAPTIAVAGVTLMVAGSLLTAWAQFAMGASWRIGYDPAERTALVTRGPFRFVRNPIYTAMLVTMIGLALALPNVVSTTLLAVSCVALEIQVRAVEEPHLLATHQEEYTRYLARTGRFVPGLSRREYRSGGLRRLACPNQQAGRVRAQGRPRV